MKNQGKNLFITALTIIVFLVLGQLFLTKIINPQYLNKSVGRTFIPDSNSTPSSSVRNTWQVSIDFGNGNKVEGGVFAQTAYDALQKIAKEKDIKIETKQYKLGVMITKIGEMAGSNQYYWSYKVNGKMGTVASDRFILKPGDQIEWEYTKV